MAIWFTADTHFGHSNIIKYCGRPFETKEEHDETIVKNWNSVIGKQDTVYHLGDFGFGHEKFLRSTADRLHGRIALIKGNHDKKCNKPEFYERFIWIKDMHMFNGHAQGKRAVIILCHYALRTWQMSNHGSYHLFGHSHGNLPGWFRSMDVGVDPMGFYPISLEDAICRLNIQYEEHVARAKAKTELTHDVKEVLNREQAYEDEKEEGESNGSEGGSQDL